MNLISYYLSCFFSLPSNNMMENTHTYVSFSSPKNFNLLCFLFFIAPTKHSINLPMNFSQYRSYQELRFDLTSRQGKRETGKKLRKKAKDKWDDKLGFKKADIYYI